MKVSEIGLSGTVWPIWLISLFGLWPLAGQIDAQIAHTGHPVNVAGGSQQVLTWALAQTTTLLLVASGIGGAFAHRLGLTSLLAHRLEARRLGKELPFAVAVGALLGIALMVLDEWLFKSLVPEAATVSRQLPGSQEQALLLGILYGGISEEVIMRWGLMTLICWLGMRLINDPSERMPVGIAWTGIVLSAVVFALGHLPVAMHSQALDAASVIRILGLNTTAGIVFGWLYWKRSLESSFVAHAAVHVCFYLQT